MPIFKLALTRPKRGSGADPGPFFLVVLVEEVVREVILLALFLALDCCMCVNWPMIMI
jgi:hypothetical protein